MSTDKETSGLKRFPMFVRFSGCLVMLIIFLALNSVVAMYIAKNVKGQEIGTYGEMVEPDRNVLRFDLGRYSVILFDRDGKPLHFYGNLLLEIDDNRYDAAATTREIADRAEFLESAIIAELPAIAKLHRGAELRDQLPDLIMGIINNHLKRKIDGLDIETNLSY